jgi:hypothetical protein
MTVSLVEKVKKQWFLLGNLLFWSSYKTKKMVKESQAIPGMNIYWPSA